MITEEEEIKNYGEFGYRETPEYKKIENAYKDPESNRVAIEKEYLNPKKKDTVDLIIEQPKASEEKILRESFEKEDTKEGVYAIANYLVSKYNIKTIPDGKRDFFYLYNEGFYTSVDAESLKSKAEIILDKLLSNHSANEIIGKIKRMTFCSRKDIEENHLSLICVNNGILNIDTLELTPHTPEVFFFRKIPVTYDPKAKCPVIMDFIESVVDKGDIPLIQEWFGFPLYRDYFLKKALIIYGEADTGKTTLINLLKRFIGEENISGLALQDLEREKFRIIKLYERYLNIKDDLDSHDIKKTGALKMATGKSGLTAQRKFGDEFEFTNFAKMVFSANKIPSTKEIDDDAYYGRWIIVEFDKVFGGGKRNPNLSAELSSSGELSGLLNWALTGLQRLRKKGEFSFNLTLEEVKQIMIMSASLVAEFSNTELVESVGNHITKKDMYEVFQRYSRKKKLPVMTKERLGRGLLKYSSYIIDSRKSLGGKQETAWLNVDLRNQEEAKMLKSKSDKKQTNLIK